MLYIIVNEAHKGHIKQFEFWKEAIVGQTFLLIKSWYLFYAQSSTGGQHEKRFRLYQGVRSTY
jgi:hypothetical protein